MKKHTYTKKDLIKRLSYKLDMRYDESKIILECVLDSFRDLFFTKSDKIHIEIRNFGVFDITITKKRTNARNPKTLENIIIPARKKIVFKPSKKIKNELYKQIER